MLNPIALLTVLAHSAPAPAHEAPNPSETNTACTERAESAQGASSTHDATSVQGAEPAKSEGLLPVPDYSGATQTRPKLTGDWGGVRQKWAEHGVTIGLDWYQSSQGIVDGGVDEGWESSTNLDYRATLDLMRMGVVPGALVTVRAQTRLGETVNEESGLLLPVNTYSAFPFSSSSDNDVDFAITELNWVQFLSEEFAVMAGKITTMKTANEFMGGEGRTQFMNFQFSYSSTLAQLAPYSTLATGVLWMPNPTRTVTSTVMNVTDSSTTSGFDDIGDGGMWATTVDYRGSVNALPGGGSFGLYYGFDGDFARIGGLNLDPGTGVTVDDESNAWAISWNGWQYISAEAGSETVDPRDGKQDRQGLGVFAQLGLGDNDTNPTAWSITGGLSGRGTIPRRDADTWGVGYFYNDLQDLDLGPLELDDSTSGFEAYYDIALARSGSLTLDAQWVDGAFQSIDDATILGLRFNASFQAPRPASAGGGGRDLSSRSAAAISSGRAT